jgi:hypothetical protein
MKALSFSQWTQLNEARGLKSIGVDKRTVELIRNSKAIGGDADLVKIDAIDAVKSIYDKINSRKDGMLGIIMLKRSSLTDTYEYPYLFIVRSFYMGSSPRDVSFSIISRNAETESKNANNLVEYRIHSTDMLMREIRKRADEGYDTYQWVAKELKDPYEVSKERRTNPRSYTKGVFTKNDPYSVEKFEEEILSKVDQYRDKLKELLKKFDNNISVLVPYAAIQYMMDPESNPRSSSDFTRTVRNFISDLVYLDQSKGDNILNTRSMMELVNLFYRYVLTGKLPTAKISAEKYLDSLGF